MSEITQRVNNLRFELLSRLKGNFENTPTADGVPFPTPEGLIREFESALAEERPTLLTLEEFRHPDKRSRAIAEAERKVAAVRSSLDSASAEHFPSIAESLAEVVKERDTALAMRQHGYKCWECEKSFTSPARRVLSLAGSVDHDETGAVVLAMRFKPPMHLVLCPGCKNKMKIRKYAGMPAKTADLAKVAAHRKRQREIPRVRE